MQRNVASQTIGAQMISATDGSAFTGSVTVAITGDNGTQATGSVGSGACTHKGSGYHAYVPAQAETDYAHIAFTFTGTGAVPQTVQLYTQPSVSELVTAVSEGFAPFDGAVATDAGNSATAFKTNLTETTDDHWNDALLVLTSGSLAGQVKKVTAYNGTTKVITVSGGFTGVPADSVTFLLINR